MNEQLKTAAEKFCGAEGISKGLCYGIAIEAILTDFAQSLIDKGMLVEAEKWISVKDRLPIVKPFQTECVLVFGDWNNESFAIFEGGKFYDRDQTDNDTGNSIEITNLVTHWMPLPAAPGKSTLSSAGKEVLEKHPLVLKFANQMQIELNNNLHKGDWSEWRDVKEILYELDYHKAKLIIALKDNNKTLVRELLADCGNFLMFLGNAGYVYDMQETTKMLDADEPGFNMYFGTQSTPKEPTVSSHGKEVTEEEIYNLSVKWAQHDPDDPTDNDANQLEQMRRSYEEGYKAAIRYKFKSSPASTVKVVTDEEIEDYGNADSHYDWPEAPAYNEGRITGAQWMRKELTGE